MGKGGRATGGRAGTRATARRACRHAPRHLPGEGCSWRRPPSSPSGCCKGDKGGDSAGMAFCCRQAAERYGC